MEKINGWQITARFLIGVCFVFGILQQDFISWSINAAFWGGILEFIGRQVSAKRTVEQQLIRSRSESQLTSDAESARMDLETPEPVTLFTTAEDKILYDEYKHFRETRKEFETSQANERNRQVDREREREKTAEAEKRAKAEEREAKAWAQAKRENKEAAASRAQRVADTWACAKRKRHESLARHAHVFNWCLALGAICLVMCWLAYSSMITHEQLSAKDSAHRRKIEEDRLNATIAKEKKKVRERQALRMAQEHEIEMDRLQMMAERTKKEREIMEAERAMRERITSEFESELTASLHANSIRIDPNTLYLERENSNPSLLSRRIKSQEELNRILDEEYVQLQKQIDRIDDKQVRSLRLLILMQLHRSAEDHIELFSTQQLTTLMENHSLAEN